MPEINIFKKYTPAELHSLIAKNLDDPSQMMTAAALLCGFLHDLTARVVSLEATVRALGLIADVDAGTLALLEKYERAGERERREMYLMYVGLRGTFGRIDEAVPLTAGAASAP